VAHQIDIGAYSSIKQSKLAQCTTKVGNNTAVGEHAITFTVPANKLWLVQQMSGFNGSEPAARVCYFYLTDELSNFVTFLSNNGIAKTVVGIGDGKTYDGFGLTYVPPGWKIGVRWFGLTVIGSVSLYLHITEVDIN
jgi:hypothetical protein